MRVEFLTKGYVATDKLKALYEKKLSKLDKFFDEDTTVKVLLRKSGDREKAEFTIMLDGIVLRAEVASTSMYDNIDGAVPKLEKQVIKHRTKIASKSKKVKIKELDLNYIKEMHDDKKAVVRSKQFNLTPMTVEDAIDELELVGHSFYVFSNKSTSTVNILYRRDDGDYGLIDAVM